MSIELNHTIVWARDKEASARFFADLLGLPVEPRSGPFVPAHPSRAHFLTAKAVARHMIRNRREVVSRHGIDALRVVRARLERRPR
jgi:catechol 2,3-dioxygenase-like lactoylglutathione lyase family enzyme